MTLVVVWVLWVLFAFSPVLAATPTAVPTDGSSVCSAINSGDGGSTGPECAGGPGSGQSTDSGDDDDPLEINDEEDGRDERLDVLSVQLAFQTWLQTGYWFWF